MNGKLWNRSDVFLIVASIIGLILFLNFFPQTSPESAINLKYSQMEIIEKASELLRKQKVNFEGYNAYASMVHNSKLLHHFQKNLGLKETNEHIRKNDLPFFYWKVRFRKPTDLMKVVNSAGAENGQAKIVEQLNKDTIFVSFDLLGNLLEYKISSKRKVARAVDFFTANQIAEGFIEKVGKINLSAYQESDTSGSYNIKESVFIFSWHRFLQPDSLQENIIIKADDSRVLEFSRSFAVPEIAKSFFLSDEMRGIIIVLFAVLIFIFLLVLLIYKLRKDQIELKHNLLLSFGVALCWVISLATSLLYSQNTGIVFFLFPILLTTPFVFLGILVASSLGESEAREVWPEKLLTMDMFRSGSFLSPQWSMSIIRGFALSFISLGILATALKIFDLNFHFFTKVDVENLYKKFSFLPIAYLFFSAIMNVSFGESIFRLLGISFLKRTVKRNFLVVSIALLAWVFTFGSYGEIRLSNFYLNFLLNAILGILLILFFIKYDFLTVVWGALAFFLILHLHPYVYYNHSGVTYNGYILWIFLSGVFFASLVGFRKKYQQKPLREYVPDYKIRQFDRERLARELEIARRVQTSFLPATRPELPGLDIASICIPALEVGGDYYDFIELGASKLGIVIGDVSGKGIPAAFHMTLMKGFIKSQAKMELHPRQALIHLNELFWENVKRGTFISMIYAIIDVQEKKVRFARAGHNPVLLKKSRDKVVETICPDGIALGLTRGKIFEENLQELEIDVKPGDVLLFYTDGFSEAMNPEKDEFGENKLKKLLENIDNLPAELILENIKSEVLDFAEGARQHDDMTMIIVKVS